MWKIIVAVVFALLESSHAEKDGKENENKTVTLGDMILTPNQFQYLFTNDTLKRHGLERSFTHWPRGVVPFKWDPLLSEEIKNLTLSAMFYISSLSCVKFEAADVNYKNFVYITSGPGCSSSVGNLRQGQQSLKLSHLCERGNIIHELLHTLGFLHMHTAPQRDDYVKIVYGNVEPQALKNFEKYTAYVSMFNTQYDYRSIMHYRREAFGVDKDKPTIIPLEPVKSMGQRQKMSEGDITRLNRMYKCPQFSEEDFIDDETDDETETDDDHEPLFEQSDVNPIENMAVEKPEAEVNNNPVVARGVWPNRIDPNQKSGVVRMLDNVASSLIYIMRPICALSNKVKILKSYLQNL